MAGKKALLSSTGVLKGFGFVTYVPVGGDTVIDVPDDFNMKANTVQWNGSAFVAFTPPPLTSAEKDVVAADRFDNELLMRAVVTYLVQQINTVRTNPLAVLTNLTAADARTGIMTVYKNLLP